VACLVLLSVMRHPHSPKKSNSRNTARPNASQIAISGDVSLLARVCPELPPFVCDNQTVQRTMSAETVSTQLTIYTS
jgi:hypothetical protein